MNCPKEIVIGGLSGVISKFIPYIFRPLTEFCRHKSDAFYLMSVLSGPTVLVYIFTLLCENGLRVTIAHTKTFNLGAVVCAYMGNRWTLKK